MTATVLLPETPVYNFYDHILLLRRHFVIGGQAESSVENIGSDIHSGAADISICAASAAPLGRYEGV